MFKRLAVHVTNYSLGTLLVIVAGLVSFPIFTRAFTLEQYGAMSLVSTTLLLATVVGKLGMQHSIVRLHAEMRAGKHAETENQFFSTVVIGMAATGAVVSLLWLVVSQLIPQSWWSHDNIRQLFALTSVLIVVRVFDSALVNLLRAEQLSGWYSIYSVARRYGVLLTTLIAVFLISPDLDGFFGGTVVAEIIATMALAYLFLRKRSVVLGEVSPRLLKAMAVFGLPMIAYEFAGVVLNLGDRYVIQSVMGAGPLGTYSAAYNMCEYVQTILVTAISQAVSPMYMRLWEEKGQEATRDFVERVLVYYALMAVAVVVCMCLAGGELLVLLASTKYASGAVIIPAVISGMMVIGALPIVGAGLFLAKKTQSLAILVICSAVLNLGLNIVIVPVHGLLGASIAMLISVTSLTIGASWLGSRTLPIRIPFASIGKFSICGLAAYGVAHWGIASVSTLGIIGKVALGACVYAAALLLVDSHCRDLARMAWARLRPAAV